MSNKTITLDDIPVTKELVQDEIEGNTPSAMVAVTYADLVTKVNDGELVPGQQYRITDYVTTTAQANTQSAGHQFDIIVTADSADTLNESARAVLHEGDTYFKNCNLAAWKIKYDIYNDTKKYAWADNVNGKGVIYEMEDEHSNKCGYDFKNIMFARYSTSGGGKVIIHNYSAMSDVWSQSIAIDDKLFPVDETDRLYFYTFSCYTGGIGDLPNELTVYNANNNMNEGCHDNIIKPIFGGSKSLSSTSKIKKRYLNNIVFIASDVVSTHAVYANIFENRCACMTFTGTTYNNKFGTECKYNMFGNKTIGNTFMSGCSSITMSLSCNSNTFGNECKSIICDKNFIYNELSANTADTFFEGTWQYNNLVTMQNASEANGQPIKNKHVYYQFSGSPTISTTADGTITFGGDIINTSPVDKPVTAAYTLSADDETDITGTLSVTAAADSTTTFSGTETGVAGKTYRVAYVISYTLGENTIQIRM